MEQHNINCKEPIQPALIALLIWLLTSIVFGIGFQLYELLVSSSLNEFDLFFLATVCAAIGSVPVFLVLAFSVHSIQVSDRSFVGKIKRLVFICFVSVLPYGAIWGFIQTSGEIDWIKFLKDSLAISGILFSCAFIAMLMLYGLIKRNFSYKQKTELLIESIGVADDIQHDYQPGLKTF